MQPSSPDWNILGIGEMKQCSVGSAIFTTHCHYTLREQDYPYVVWARVRRNLGAGLAACEWRPVSQILASLQGLCLSGAGRDRRGLHRLRRHFPSNRSPPSSQPVTFAARSAQRPTLATAGLLPPVSPGKRSAASVRDHYRARASGSGRAEDAWSCARTRELCRSESHSDPLLPVTAPLWGLVAWLEPSGWGEWTLFGRALTDVVSCVTCEWGPGLCAGACILGMLRASWEKGFQI